MKVNHFEQQYLHRLSHLFSKLCGIQKYEHKIISQLDFRILIYKNPLLEIKVTGFLLVYFLSFIL